jgi:hypothetical protein
VAKQDVITYPKVYLGFSDNNIILKLMHGAEVLWQPLGCSDTQADGYEIDTTYRPVLLFGLVGRPHIVWLQEKLRG